jgi:hypothetical protein
MIDLFKKKRLDGIAFGVKEDWSPVFPFSKNGLEEFPEVDSLFSDSLARNQGLGSVSFCSTEYGKIFSLCYERGSGMGRRTNYEAIYLALEEMKIYLKPNFRIAIPFELGCKKSGGSWKIVSAILSELFEESEQKLIICKKD